ncbi:hypothetical protein Pla22_42590 [Rubripirellula amarantea]|uniref:Uncharacterized protein n=1 Tax=Rubripirellula amarantea TaxID=2527999 RepID=A0A5C5WN03_9BACT|nr:hypothetical protein Pla22_42590 [Rubripirellula amarantea]
MIRSLRFRNAFIILLLAGPFAVLPFLTLMPTFSVSSAAWRNVPRTPWRIAVSVSVVAAFLLTIPKSPFFVGLDRPIPVPIFEAYADTSNAFFDLVAMQCYLLNAALIASFAMLPINAIHTYSKIRSGSSNG